MTDDPEGQAALEAASNEAAKLGVELIAVNLTGSDLDTSALTGRVSIEVIEPRQPSRLDEVEVVLEALEARSDVSLLVLGVRDRSLIGKVVLGSIPQRLILAAAVPVLSIKAGG